MVKAGDVVTVDFQGATGIKRRPAVVISTDAYHAARPDVLLGIVTTNIVSATAATDYLLQDWAAAGLHAPSAFRTYLNTAAASSVVVIGQLSARDWQEVQVRLRLSLAVQ